MSLSCFNVKKWWLLAFALVFCSLTFALVCSAKGLPRKKHIKAPSIKAPSIIDPKCDLVANWLLANRRLEAPSLEDRITAASDEREARLRATESAYSEFMEEKLDKERLYLCIANESNRGNFLNTLHQVFYDQSLKRLALAPSPIIRRFVAQLQKKHENGSNPLFRLSGHYQEDSPSTLKAGFHRSAGSIYIDFTRVPASEWLLIFVHELLHSLDDNIGVASKFFHDEDNVNFVTDLKERKLSLNQLEPREADLLQAWIISGLDRGLLAEYRAWLLTFVIYQEGLKANLWQPIPWMDQVLTENTSRLPLTHYLYRFLDERMPSPTVGVAASSLVLSAVREIRSRLANAKEAPPLGTLQFILAGDR